MVMDSKKKRFDLYSLLLSVVYVALGLVLIIWPDTSARAICSALGVLLLLAGGFHVISYFMQSHYSSMIRQSLTIGLVLLLLGAFILLRTDDILKAMPFVFGILLVIDSATKVQAAFDLRRLQAPYWYAALLIGIVTAILGIILVVNPFTAIVVLNIFIGASLIINAVSNLISSILLSHKYKSMDNAEHWNP